MPNSNKNWHFLLLLLCYNARMKEIDEYFIKNNIFLTDDVETQFCEIFTKYKFQEIAIVGQNLFNKVDKLRKCYKVTFVEIPPELCYNLAGVNLARLQLKENTRLLVAFGDEHALNLAKLLSNKIDVPYVYITDTYLSVYTQCPYAIMDAMPIFIKHKLRASLVYSMPKFDFADAFSQTMAHLLGVFESYLCDKFFQTRCALNTKMIFDTYFELLETNGKFENDDDRKFLLKLNLLLVVQYGLVDDVPFCDSYYLTHTYLIKNVRQFKDFAKINFVFSQMLAVLYEIYFKNELQSPLYVMRDDFEQRVSLGQYAQALAKVPANMDEKLNYIYKVYARLLEKLAESFQNLYQKTSFYVKNLIDDSGYSLFCKLKCETLIDTIKHTSLLNRHTLLYKFGITIIE